MLTFVKSLAFFVAISILVLAENPNEGAGVEGLRKGGPTSWRVTRRVDQLRLWTERFGCNARNVFSKTSLGKMRFERKNCEMNEEKTAVWPLQCVALAEGLKLERATTRCWTRWSKLVAGRRWIRWITARKARNHSLDLPYPLSGPHFLSSDLAINDACQAALELPAEDGRQYQRRAGRKAQLLPESRSESRRFFGTLIFHALASNNSSFTSTRFLSRSHSLSLASNRS